MLVLTRKRGELIQIDGNIQVTVISVQGNRVRLGIEAPDSVSVRRGELVFEIVNEDAPQQEEPLCV
jgi:carbon storage regulator